MNLNVQVISNAFSIVVFVLYLIIDWILWIGNTSDGCLDQFVDLIAQLVVDWAYFFQNCSNFNQTINRRITFNGFAWVCVNERKNWIWKIENWMFRMAFWKPIRKHRLSNRNAFSHIVRCMCDTYEIFCVDCFFFSFFVSWHFYFNRFEILKIVPEHLRSTT